MTVDLPYDYADSGPNYYYWWAKGQERKSLWCIDEDQWSLNLGIVTIASHLTFDLQKAQHLWSIIPGWLSLPAWWNWADGALAQGSISQEIYDAPVNMLVAKWQWCHGEISDDELEVALTTWHAAWADCDASADSTCSDAWHVVISAWSSWDAAWTIGDVSSAKSTWVARDAADLAAVNVSYLQFCDLFTEFILHCVKHDMCRKIQ